MIWIFAALAGVGVFVVAAVAVGRETYRLGHQLPASIVDLDEAVTYVAEDLPEDAQARLSYDDVRMLIDAQLEYMREEGIVGMRGAEPAVGAPDGRTGKDEIVVEDQDALAVVLGRADEAGLELEDDDAHAVIASLHRYLADTGAVGPTA